MVALDFFDEYHFCRGCPSFVELIGLPRRYSLMRSWIHDVPTASTCCCLSLV